MTWEVVKDREAWRAVVHRVAKSGTQLSDWTTTNGLGELTLHDCHWDPESVMPSSHLILCRPLLLLPPIPPSIRVFSNESTLRIRWPKYWNFSFSISPSSEHPGLISFRMDWLDLLAVQGTLKILLQHHNSKASIFLALSFLHSPTLTSIHDNWKNHSLDQTDLCWQSNVSAF